jgi:hypothetical protein
MIILTFFPFLKIDEQVKELTISCSVERVSFNPAKSIKNSF